MIIKNLVIVFYEISGGLSSMAEYQEVIDAMKADYYSIVFGKEKEKSFSIFRTS